MPSQDFTERTGKTEFAAETLGDTAPRQQRDVGDDWFDAVAIAISGRQASTTALSESTETARFHNGGVCETVADHGHDDGLDHNRHWSLHDYWEAVDRALAAQ